MRLVVGSRNPVKLRAAQRGFARLFADTPCEVEVAEVASGVSHQPLSDRETLAGARERARQAQAARPTADLWLGIEGGVEWHDGALLAFAWVVALDSEREGRGRSGSFVLPPAVAERVAAGVELGQADDEIFGRVNSKHDNGAVGLLTGDAIDRTALYEHAVVLALIPFRNPALFPRRA